MQRQAEAAAALRASPWFVKWPQRHVILASSHSTDDHDPLGALGSLAAKAGVVALCVDREKCQAGFRKKAIVPPLPLPPLLLPSVRQRQAAQACAKGGSERRRVSVYWRGRHTKDADAGALRSRLWALKAIPGADIKFVSGGGEISGDSRSWLKAHGWTKDTRLPYSASTYASGVSHADFCLIVQGEAKGTGRALVDAVAAGCVPLLLGSLSPPHGKLLRYDAFSRTIDTAEFLRYPVEATKAVIDAAVPELPKLRRALIAAREDLILGFGAAPLAAAAGSFATIAGADRRGLLPRPRGRLAPARDWARHLLALALQPGRLLHASGATPRKRAQLTAESKSGAQHALVQRSGSRTV